MAPYDDDMDVYQYRTNGDGMNYIVARADSIEKATTKANKVYEYIKSDDRGQRRML